MKTKWTVDGIMNERPCYTREKVQALWGRRKALTLREILALKIPAADRLWVAWRPEALTIEEQTDITTRIVTRAITNHALKCGVPAVEQWAVKWLDGTDRTAEAAAAARAAAMAAGWEAAEWAAAAARAAAEQTKQIMDVRAVIRKRE